MKKNAIGIAALAALIGTPALAADMAVKVPPPIAAPTYGWTGFYVGANVGGHWSNDNDTASLSATNEFSGGLPAALGQDASANLHPSGIAGGAQIGYNWQINSLVYGLEGDFEWLAGTANRNLVTPEPGDPASSWQFTDSASDRWMSTLRARLGWTADRFLIYITGGVAFSEWQLDHFFFETQPGPIGTTNNTVFRTGWTVGGGLEYALNTNWFVRAEYLYANFGTANINMSAPVPGNPAIFNVIDHSQKLSENLARFGISYKFNP